MRLLSSWASSRPVKTQRRLGQLLNMSFRGPSNDFERVNTAATGTLLLRKNFHILASKILFAPER